MKSVLSLIALPAVALAASIPRQENTGSFSASVVEDISPAGTTINASGGKFYISETASTYCPEGTEGLDCADYAGTGTTFAVSGATTLSLDVTVPGGQQVYVAPDGALSYTQAHSAAIPADSVLIGFSRLENGNLKSEGRQFFLCSVEEEEAEAVNYQIYVSDQALESCTVTEVTTSAPASGNVWQYA
ncbi:hypothetical protein F4808DRAFT_442742 [Astrocystis sublimbata]|nr:hypothetical protein F4808DRAFT_442742 [Astrocystis sublimbata]